MFKDNILDNFDQVCLKKLVEAFANNTLMNSNADSTEINFAGARYRSALFEEILKSDDSNRVLSSISIHNNNCTIMLADRWNPEFVMIKLDLDHFKEAESQQQESLNARCKPGAIYKNDLSEVKDDPIKDLCK